MFPPFRPPFPRLPLNSRSFCYSVLTDFCVPLSLPLDDHRPHYLIMPFHSISISLCLPSSPSFSPFSCFPSQWHIASIYKCAPWWEMWEMWMPDTYNISADGNQPLFSNSASPDARLCLPQGSIWHSLRLLDSLASHTTLCIYLSLTHSSFMGSPTVIFSHTPLPWCCAEPHPCTFCFTQPHFSDAYCRDGSGLAVGERRAVESGRHSH